VQAFNTSPARVLELPRERLAARRVSLFVCSDDAAVDGGELIRARIVDGLVTAIRFQITAMGRGMFTTISLDTLPEAP
jgi:hypothetical protein